MESLAPGPDLAPLVGTLEVELDERLGAVDAALAGHYPGERPGRQPVHTVYVPADRFHAGLVAEHGAAALAAIDAHEELLLGLLDGDEDLLARVRRPRRRVGASKPLNRMPLQGAAPPASIDVRSSSAARRTSASSSSSGRVP